MCQKMSSDHFGGLNSVLCCGLFLLISIGVGCQSQPSNANAKKTRPRPRQSIPNAIDPDKLRNELSMFLNEAYSQIIGTANEIAYRTKDRRVRENTLRLKIRVSSAMRQIVMDPDPRNAFITSWILIAQSKHYYTKGQGKDAFGDQQQMIVDMTNTASDKILALAKRHFPKNQIDNALDEIEEIAQEYPLTSHFLPEGSTAVSKQIKKERNDLEVLLNIPMAPVTGLKGVADTADAINQFSHVAEGFTVVARAMPERVRWQMELLLLETESLGTVQDFRADLSRIATTFQDAVDSINALPDKMKKELVAVLKQSDQQQLQMQSTLKELNQALSTYQTSVKETKDLTSSMNQTVEQFTQAAKAWETTSKQVEKVLIEFDKLDKKDEKEDKPGVKEYTEMAKQIEQAAAQVRQLLVDVDAPEKENGRTTQLATQLDGLIDKVTMRLLMLIGVMFGLAVCYLFLRRKVLGGGGKN